MIIIIIMRVGQWLTPTIIFGSFAYVPFIVEGGMLLFYVDLTSAFVIPLLTLFFMGTLTSVHRRAGLIGLLVGTAYGVVRLRTPMVEEHLGVTLLWGPLANSWVAYPASMVISAATMVLCSFFLSWEEYTGSQWPPRTRGGKSLAEVEPEGGPTYRGREPGNCLLLRPADRRVGRRPCQRLLPQFRSFLVGTAFPCRVTWN